MLKLQSYVPDGHKTFSLVVEVLFSWNNNSKHSLVSLSFSGSRVLRGEERDDLVRKGQTSLFRLVAVEDDLQSSELRCAHLGRVDGQLSSRLQTRNRNRRGRNLPAEGDRLRRVIDGDVR